MKPDMSPATALTMVQLRPDMGSLLRWATREGLVAERGPDDLGYALHVALKRAFGERAPQPFALIDTPNRQGRSAAPSILGYTSLDPETLRGNAALADPEMTTALGLGDIAAKPMPTTFAAGTRLGFRVRVRPTVRRDRDGDRNRTREHDAYLAAIEPFAVVDGVGSAPVSRADVYRAWLAARLEAGGAALGSASLDAFQLTRTLRRDRARTLRSVPEPAAAVRMGGAAGHPDATFAGTLTVTNPAGFAALLARGVGRHRAFGFGMLLLRPAG